MHVLNFIRFVSGYFVGRFSLTAYIQVRIPPFKVPEMFSERVLGCQRKLITSLYVGLFHLCMGPTTYLHRGYNPFTKYRHLPYGFFCPSHGMSQRSRLHLRLQRCLRHRFRPGAFNPTVQTRRFGTSMLQRTLLLETRCFYQKKKTKERKMKNNII